MRTTAIHRVAYGVVLIGFCYILVYHTWMHLTGNGHVYRLSKENSNQVPIVKQDIYFLETSGRNFLDHRQLASVESIARFVHHDTITVLVFSNQTIEYNAAMLALNSTYGVRFEKSEMGPFFIGTPLKVWYNSEVWKNGNFRTEHSSDALRAALLWKNGGIYFDLDFIMIKQANFTKPSLVFGPKKNIANGFMAFDEHSELLKLYMAAFARTYNPDIYNANGPILFNKVFQMYLKELKSQEKTSDIKIFKSELMSTLPWANANLLFSESDKEKVLQMATNETLAVNIWNSRTKNTKVKATSDCAYLYYVKNSSPMVYAEMLRNGTV